MQRMVLPRWRATLKHGIICRCTWVWVMYRIEDKRRPQLTVALVMNLNAFVIVIGEWYRVEIPANALDMRHPETSCTVELGSTSFQQHTRRRRYLCVTNTSASRTTRQLLDLLLDLLCNECSHIQHIQCTNTLTSYMLKHTHMIK